MGYTHIHTDVANEPCHFHTHSTLLRYVLGSRHHTNWTALPIQPSNIASRCSMDHVYSYHLERTKHSYRLPDPRDSRRQIKIPKEIVSEETVAYFPIEYQAAYFSEV